MPYKDKECATCGSLFEPRAANQQSCDDCRLCECGLAALPGKAGLCKQCQLEKDPYSWQCPMVDCLEYYKASNHKCPRRGKGRPKKNDHRLARVNRDSDLRILVGPGLSEKAQPSLTDIPLAPPEETGGPVCRCGSPISGRSLWGDSWGGGCDRAEERVSNLMETTS